MQVDQIKHLLPLAIDRLEASRTKLRTTTEDGTPDPALLGNRWRSAAMIGLLFEVALWGDFESGRKLFNDTITWWHKKYPTADIGVGDLQMFINYRVQRTWCCPGNLDQLTGDDLSLTSIKNWWVEPKADSHQDGFERLDYVIKLAVEQAGFGGDHPLEVAELATALSSKYLDTGNVSPFPTGEVPGLLYRAAWLQHQFGGRLPAAYVQYQKPDRAAILLTTVLQDLRAFMGDGVARPEPVVDAWVVATARYLACVYKRHYPTPTTDDYRNIVNVISTVAMVAYQRNALEGGSAEHSPGDPLEALDTMMAKINGLIKAVL